jgi:N-methylhydantoinase A
VKYICGIDAGGTFTDCVVVDSDGRITISKSPSTPGDFSKGMFDALDVAAGKLGLSPEEFLPDVEALFHGTTVATNAMVERKGVRAALIATVGHGDALRIMRGAGRTAGLSPEEYLQVSRASKPDPIVPRRLIGEVHERVDSKGEVVVELDEEQAREEIRKLLAQDVRSIAVSLLWSFRNPVHELRLRELITEEAAGADVYVTLSHELLPKLGEYERSAGTAINAYIGPLIADYFADLRQKADERGMTGPVMVMQASGGLADSRRVVEVALQTIGSGPVAGASAPHASARSPGCRTGSAPTSAGPRSTLASSSTAGRSGGPRASSASTSTRCRRWTSVRSGPAAAVSPGSTRSRKRCGSARRAPVPTRGPPPTGAAAPSRPSPTPTSSSATSTPTTSSAAK